MSVAPCPRCHDDVTVPSGAPPEALVQCPLCREEFELSEIQKAMPPALIVVKLPKLAAAGASVRDSGPDFAFDTEGDGEDYTFAPEADQEAAGAPAFAFSGEAATSGAPAAGTRKAVKATPRKKKKQSNPAVEIAKVAFGGAGGVLIAIILLWYLPGRYGQDILGIGPTIGSIPVVGSIVPAKFRGAAGTNDGNSAQNDPPELDPILRVDPGPDDGSPKRSIADYANAANNSNDNTANNRNGGNQNRPRNNQNAGNSGNNKAQPSGSGSPNVNPIELPAVDFANIEPEPNEPPPSDTGPRAPGGQALGPVDPPAVTPDDLVASVEAVNKSVVNYADQEAAGLTGQPLKEAATRHYNDFASLAKAITFVDQKSEVAIGEAQAADQLLRELASVPSKAGRMQYFAASDIASPSEPNKGIVLVGKVLAASKVDRLYSTTIEITPAGNPPVQVKVLGIKDPTDIVSGFEIGRQVGVLGVLVPAPETNLSGYKGNDPVVVWGGYFIMLNDDA